MICCADLVLLLGGVVVGDTVPPAAVAHDVTTQLAAAWSVEPADIVLAWGTWPGDTARHAGAQVRLMAAPGREGWVTAQVRPPTGAPVAVQLRAGVRAAAQFSTRPLVPGQVLGPGDLTTGMVVQWGPPRPDDLAVSLGWEIQRAVPAGARLVAPAVAPPVGVRAGEMVLLRWSRGLVEVEVEAEAMATARVGETVRARRGATQYSGTLIAPGIGRLDARRPT